MKRRLTKINKKKVIIFTSIFLVILLPLAYAAYTERKDVNINTTSGRLSYDIVLDQNDNYIENNEPYFFIIIKNYDKDGLTSATFEYQISVVNTGDEKASYRYIDDDGNTNTTPSESLNLTGTLDNVSKKEFKYKVYVSNDSNLKTKVNYKVDYNVIQKNMDE